MCTLHADSSSSAFSKICTYALMAREQVPIEATSRMIADSVHLVVHLRKLADGSRAVSSVREVVGSEGTTVLSNEVFAPGRDGRAEPRTPFTEAGLARLVANGLDRSVLGARR
jgi:Flp pilus assembly CpaF family ATPase